MKQLEKASGKAREAQRKRKNDIMELRKKEVYRRVMKSVKYPQGIKVRTEKHLLGEAIRRSRVTLAMGEEVTEV